MSLIRVLPLIFAGVIVPPVLGSFIATGIPLKSDKQKFEATATVRSVQVACRYSRWLIKSSGPAITSYIPCVPREEIAEQYNLPLNKVSVSKFTVAEIYVTEISMAPRTGYIITKLHFVGGDPMGSGNTQDRYENVRFRPKDKIMVGYYADEPEPQRETFFYVEHRS